MSKGTYAPRRLARIESMATKYDLERWVEEAVRSRGGSATLVDVARAIWERHEPDLIVLC
jgi:hypothetical protein